MDVRMSGIVDGGRQSRDRKIDEIDPNQGFLGDVFELAKLNCGYGCATQGSAEQPK